MKTKAIATNILILATAALATEKLDPQADKDNQIHSNQTLNIDDSGSTFSELDAKIKRNLADEKWNQASKSFVAALYQDYRAAHSNPPKQASQATFGKKPDVESYDDYLGAYTRESVHGAYRPLLEVVKDEAGRFHVKMEGHAIPAVTVGKTVVFTTGDVVHAPPPSLAEKPYCTLEMLTIIRSEGRFFFGSPSAPPDRWMPLRKSEKP